MTLYTYLSISAGNYEVDQCFISREFDDLLLEKLICYNPIKDVGRVPSSPDPQ